MELTHEDWLDIAEALEFYKCEYQGAHAEHDADNWQKFEALRAKVAALCDAAAIVAKGE